MKKCSPYFPNKLYMTLSRKEQNIKTNNLENHMFLVDFIIYHFHKHRDSFTTTKRSTDT